MANEKELIERIRQLEELNGRLQDKLDLIYSIVATEDEDDEEDDDNGLVQIAPPPKPDGGRKH